MKQPPRREPRTLKPGAPSKLYDLLIRLRNAAAQGDTYDLYWKEWMDADEELDRIEKKWSAR